MTPFASTQAGDMMIDRADSVLLVIDMQARLMPVIHAKAPIVARAGLLAEAARRLGVPSLRTEQNSLGLGPTVPELEACAAPPIEKRHFDACSEPGLLARLPAERRTIVALGCEAHVCVLQTVLGLLRRGYSVCVVADAVGSRRAEDKAAALARMDRHGAQTVTAEMVVFEWLACCDDPEFRGLLPLIKKLQ